MHRNRRSRSPEYAISGETAAVHVKSVLKKLGVSTRMQAVAIGVALGMIKP
jgi:DNA-binding CsgD family transcriptional regulator